MGFWVRIGGKRRIETKTAEDRSLDETRDLKISAMLGKGHLQEAKALELIGHSSWSSFEVSRVTVFIGYHR